MCGSEIARFECKDCQIFTNGIRINSYCSDCNDQVHKHRDRSNHRPRPLLPPRQFHNSKQIAAKHKMELFAVVCIETSHYVAFVKCGVGADAPWCFFDSMADRKGERKTCSEVIVARMNCVDERGGNEADLLKSF